MRLENKVVLLCGVGQGMGRAMALLFAQEGARLALVARKTSLIESTTMYICEEIGGQAIFIQADVAEKAQIEAAVAQTLDTFGRRDVYVTLAGGGFKHTHDLTEMDEDLLNLFRNHLLSLFHGARAVIPHFKSAGGGAMLTVAACRKPFKMAISPMRR